MTRALAIRRLGRVEYDDGLRLMQVFAEARRAGTAPDTLLLCEHPDVITFGRGGKETNLVASREAIARAGVELHETDRGGDVTWHGPGQVVGYPVFDLAPDRKDVRRYVRDLEEVMIRAAAVFGVRAERVEGLTGVWVGLEKLGAIGVHLSRWITTHGFAFNVAPDLSRFELIVPCGISDRGVTSLARLTGRPVSMDEAERAIVRAVAEVFGCDPFEVAPELETVQVVVTRGDEVLLLQRTEERGGFWQPVTGRIAPGESPDAAAARELLEETGLTARPVSLGYVHSFALDPRVVAGEGARVCREHTFAARAPEGAEVRVDPAEHQAHAWLAPDRAASLVPFAGLRRGIRLASGL